MCSCARRASSLALPAGIIKTFSPRPQPKMLNRGKHYQPRNRTTSLVHICQPHPQLTRENHHRRPLFHNPPRHLRVSDDKRQRNKQILKAQLLSKKCFSSHELSRSNVLSIVPNEVPLACVIVKSALVRNPVVVAGWWGQFLLGCGGRAAKRPLDGMVPPRTIGRGRAGFVLYHGRRRWPGGAGVGTCTYVG